MDDQAVNPFLPAYEYIPDGEPYVFGDRVYLYGSHDRFDGRRYCQNDYVCWSAPVTDLSAWRFEGTIYRKDQDPRNKNGRRCLYAPDLQQGPDGRYYLYYSLNLTGVLSVAVSDAPAGPFTFYGHVRYADGRVAGQEPGDVFQFDPGVLVDDDGRVHLYSGFALEPHFRMALTAGERLFGGGYYFELAPDMITIKRGPILVFPRESAAAGSSFTGHGFFEASSLRKIDGRYYFIYSSVHGHELCYAVSDRPDGGFVFGGTLISNGDIFFNGRAAAHPLNYTGNNHGSIVQIDGRWYVFYHRQTNRHPYSRQACAEPITIGPNGRIQQVEMTSSGLHGGPLDGRGRYPARIACNLFAADGARPYGGRKRELAGHPYFTQEGPDREEGEGQYIANMRDGAVAGFKYFALQGLSRIVVTVRGDVDGCLNVYTKLSEHLIATIPVHSTEDWTDFAGETAVREGIFPLYFRFHGRGALDFRAFHLA